MKAQIKYWSKTYRKEDLGFFKIILLLLLMMAAFMVGSESGFIFIFFGCMYLSYHIVTLHERHNVTPLLHTTGFSIRNQNFCAIIVSFSENIMILLLEYIYVQVFFRMNPVLAILFCLLIYAYANLIGIYLGRLIKSYVGGLFVLILLFIFLFFTPNTLQEQNFRYVSPILQLYNLKDIHMVNILGMVFGSLMMLLTLFLKNFNRLKVAIISSLCVFLFCGILTVYEYQLEREVNRDNYRNIEITREVGVQYKGISQEYAAYLGNVIFDVQEKLLQYRLADEIYPVTVVRSYYFPWESNREKIPFRIDDTGRIYVQCFSHSMLNMEIGEIFRRTFNEVLNPRNKIQSGLANQLQSLVQYEVYHENKRNYFSDVEITEVENFFKNAENYFYASEMENYGKLFSPQWVFYTEVAYHYIESFPAIYRLAGEQEDDTDFVLFLERVEAAGIFNGDKGMETILSQIKSQIK